MATANAGTSAVPATAGGFCNVSGCYYKYDDFHSDFQSSNGFFGVAGQTLGTVSFYVDWQITGASTVSRPVRWSTTSATVGVLWSGDLINAAKGVVGTQVPGAFAPYVLGSAAPSVQYTWNPNGYKSYDNTMYDHSQVHEFTWSVAGYPGSWYVYVKSISAHTSALGTGAIYRFRSDLGTPASPYGGGYNG
jgi:hypothetical protein